MSFKAVCFLFLTLSISCQKQQLDIDDKFPDQVNEISFWTTDSIQIFGDLYELDNSAPSILLFHQGGSNAKGEYGPIIPRLIGEGFNILAIDQRMGGQIYGHYNRTIAELPDYNFADTYTYCDAINNLEAALDYMITAGFTGSKILWGSSYSASLAIGLGHKRQSEIDKVLAFSPASGGSMQSCKPDSLFEHLNIPLLICRPPNEMANENVAAQFSLAESFGHEVYAPQFGKHGSSILVEERVGNDVSDIWQVVLDFLQSEK